MVMKRLLAVGLAFLVGCSGGEGDDAQSGNGALSAPGNVAATPPPSPAAATDAGSAPASSGDKSADSSGPITLDNFISHPKIVEIRQLVDQIDGMSLTHAHKVEPCEPGSFERDKGADAAGAVRKLEMTELDGVDQDKTVADYYYDANGHIRFAFLVIDASLGETSFIRTEVRVYFDTAGQRIFEVDRSATSLDFPGPDVSHAPFKLPSAPTNIDANILSNPTAAFDKAQCI
jgi:hypothetical protein